VKECLPDQPLRDSKTCESEYDSETACHYFRI
jgi:hypothetical protein